MTVTDQRSMSVIRSARPEDADRIASTFLASAGHHACLDPERYRIPAVEIIRARYHDRLAAPEASRVMLVADLGGDVVGFIEAILDESPDPMHQDITYCHVVEIAVNDEHRSHGIGARLLRAAEEWGRCRGATFASLEYHIANGRAGAFYRGRMGYEIAAVTAIKRLRPTPDTFGGE